MNDKCETVVVVGEDGQSLIINAIDFDETKYQLFEVDIKKEDLTLFDREAAKAYLIEKGVEFNTRAKNETLEELVEKTKAAEEGKPKIEEKDGKFVVVNANGEPMGEPYETKESAEAVLAAIGG